MCLRTWLSRQAAEGALTDYPKTQQDWKMIFPCLRGYRSQVIVSTREVISNLGQHCALTHNQPAVWWYLRISHRRLSYKAVRKAQLIVLTRPFKIPEQTDAKQKQLLPVWAAGFLYITYFWWRNKDKLKWMVFLFLYLCGDLCQVPRWISSDAIQSSQQKDELYTCGYLKSHVEVKFSSVFQSTLLKAEVAPIAWIFFHRLFLKLI